MHAAWSRQQPKLFTMYVPLHKRVCVRDQKRLELESTLHLFLINLAVKSIVMQLFLNELFPSVN